jgi:hypothetical protein
MRAMKMLDVTRKVYIIIHKNKFYNYIVVEKSFRAFT